MATHENIPADLLNALRAEADADDCMSWEAFSRQALYHETEGYYRRRQTRVGQRSDTDFFTSVSVGPLFGELVAEAARQLIAPANPADFMLAEIGAEPEGGMFQSVDTGFGAVQTFPLGHTFTPATHTVLVANEVLDAQPFHRLEFHQGRWREWGVQLFEGRLIESPLKNLTDAVSQHLLPDLPENMPEGYRVDLSLAAESLLADWATGSWQGGMILIDYGKYWDELLQVTPQGTARAYYRHQQETDLLARPGQQDLTTHVCWDRLEKVLRQRGLMGITVERQEAFLVKRAFRQIEALSTEPRNRGPLQTLLHPGGFGAKFQALIASKNRA